jgi:hypothetical protein
MPAACGAAAFALILVLAPLPVRTQEWDEAYRSGLTALARGDHARAVDSFRRAIARRPEPGRNVPTYGTNIEPRYFPYLRLAEAHLGLGQLEAAREALEKSASWGAREPADERQKLVARLEAAIAQRRPPPPSPPPSTPAPVALPTAAPVVTLPAESPSPAPTAAAASASPSAVPREPVHPGHVIDQEPRPRAEASASRPASPAPAAEAATGTLEIVSQPAGASTYVDDEPLGVTDPQTGRLVKTGLAPGRHRVRVAHAGYEDAVRDVEVARGGSAAFYATLTPLPAVSSGARAGFIALAVVAIGLVGVLAWMALRRPEERTLTGQATPRMSGSVGVSTPPEQMNPGARSDERGQEWFGDFRLLGMLGRGGMASVFKVERRGEISALKRPLERLLDDAQFRERFLREAEIGRTLNHPNIVRILERGNVGTVPYFTMELLPGETLQDFAGRGPAAPRTAAAIMVQVAEALDFAHSKGVVHRDLKPSNVMLLPDGTAKVMDFGIARAHRFEGLTATAAFVGTPNYVSPETIEGRPIGPRSDLYAVGLVFFELLTGQPPFTGETPYAILKKHCTEEPVPPSRLQNRVPAELDAIVLQLLRKDPDERPASAEDLVVALREWLNRAA